MSLDNIHRDGDAVVLGDHVLGHGQHGLGVHPHPRNLKYISYKTYMYVTTFYVSYIIH